MKYLHDLIKERKISMRPEVYKNIDDFVQRTRSSMKKPGLNFNWGPSEDGVWKSPNIKNMFTTRKKTKIIGEESIKCDHTPILIKKLVRNGEIQYTSYCRRCRLCGYAINSSGGIIGGKRINGGQWIKKELLTNEQMSRAIDTEEFFHKNQKSFDRYREFHDTIDDMVVVILKLKWWDWYNTYLESPEWFEIRDFILYDQWFGCCGINGCDNKATIAHHLNYDNVGNEDYKDLIAICKQHHDLIHTSNDGLFKRNANNYDVKIFLDYFGRSI